jgi:4-carboxymuconolactone decarboxylase
LTSEDFEQGMKTRREVLGDAHVDRSLANQEGIDHQFQQFITEVAWGKLWSNDRLDRESRSLITIAILAALGRSEELELHMRASRAIGVTPEQLAETLQHVAIYAGLPAANSGFRTAKKVLETESRNE